MKPVPVAAVGGCGCGAVTALVSFFVCGGGSVLGLWGAYEADLTEMKADAAVPVSVGLATVGAPVAGVIAAVLVGGLLYALLSRRAA